ncbi:MAG: YfhO family protein [Bacteroidales bacterium]|nr:YfhO family protein [Bacteroidales bacterium]
MEIKNLNKGLPHLIALVIFLVLSYIYFYPVVEGKVLKANDSMVSKINSKEIQDYREKFGKEPLWTNSIFSGMPAFLISTKYPGNLLKHVDTLLRIFKMPVAVLFLSMAGFYLLLILFGLNPWLSLTGALAYGFSSFFFQILAAGHNTQAIALAYMAPMIGGVWYAYRRDAMKGALLTAFMLALELLANHPQITYYAFICLLIFIIIEFIFSLKEKKIVKFFKTSALLMTAVIIAAGINFASLYTVYEYGKYSIRGKSDLVSENRNVSAGLNRDYITNWSYGIDETLNLLVPNFKGGSSKPFDRDSETVKALRQNNAAAYTNQVLKYWGTQPGTEGPHYVGAIVIFLFVLGLLVVKGPEKWWLVIATLLSVMLAWGKNFMPLTNLFIDFFPGYNKFRAVTMTLVISQFCIPLLGVLALKEFFEDAGSSKRLLKGLKIATGITGGILLLIIIFPGIAGSFLSQYETGYPVWLKDALVSDRKSLLMSDSLRSLIFVILASGTLFAMFYGKLRKEHAILLTGLLILIDLFSVDKRYLNADRFERPSSIQKSIAPTTADEAILKDPSYHRVLNLSVSTFNDNSPTSYYHKSIGGYHGAKLKRYQELIDSVLMPEIMMIVTKSETASSAEDLIPVFDNTPVLNMLNAKYVIYNPEASPIVNKNSLGNAWFVEKVVLAENANEELAMLDSFNPLTEAVIDKRFSDLIKRNEYPSQPDGKIELTSYQPNELIYRFSSQDEELVVFSEIYYPAGWKSFVDGKEVPHFRVNYVLRGMVVPTGDHEIRFSFEPASYITGNRISLASSLVFIILAAGFIISAFVKRST